MAVAARVLSEMDGGVAEPRSVRSSGYPPWARRVGTEDLPVRLPELIAEELRETGDGKIAVLLPAPELDELGPKLVEAVPEAVIGTTPEGLLSPVVLLTVEQAKGLEFDSVLVVDPAQILTESPRGHNDLYVALTRTTKRLGIVHPGDLPDVLSNLS
jgi:DNA helicase IV